MVINVIAFIVNRSENVCGDLIRKFISKEDEVFAFFLKFKRAIYIKKINLLTLVYGVLKILFFKPLKASYFKLYLNELNGVDKKIYIMRLKDITFFNICSIVVVCVAMMFYFKPNNEIIYSSKVDDVDNFEVEEDERYIILYPSYQNKYYLGTVLGSDALEDVLY